LENIFYKKTAVIIAGGPSLDKDILNIKNIKNKILIIAVDTAVKKLLNEDICPDIIVSIDISHHNLKHLQNVNCNSILFCDIAMPKSITEKFYSIYFTTGNSISNWIDRQINYNYPIVSIGTVTAAAFDIAYKLGNKNIIFLGTDFCYSSYKTHCETFFNSSMINTLNKFKTFESYFFDSIANDNFIIENKITTSKFLNWKTWFESQIKVLRKNNSINFFNATSDGLKIHGTKNIPSKDIIKFCGSFFDYYNSIKKFKSADSGFFEVSALLEKKLKEYIVSTNDLIKSIEKYFLRLDKFNAHNKTNIMNKIIFLFNKLFRGNDLSDIIRWGLYLDELTFRNLDFLKIEKFDFNINELKQILSNYKKYINVILESL
jgi:hypothetical protein